MKYLKKFNEETSYSPYKVVMIFGHGGSCKVSEKSVEFNDEDDVREFLNFIWDIMNFQPNSGWENLGHFSMDHYQRLDENIKKIDAKYGNKFAKYIEVDKHYGKDRSNYRAEIDGVYVIDNNNPLHIIWSKALKTNLIDLPKMGDTISLSTGNINGSTLGRKEFGGKSSDYLDYSDFSEILESNHEYHEIEVKVTDIKIRSEKTYKHEDYIMKGDEEVLKSSIIKYYNFTSFHYCVLCRIADKYVVTEYHGYDPKYSEKYHRPKYGTNDYFLV